MRALPRHQNNEAPGGKPALRENFDGQAGPHGRTYTAA
jgi:hypothetical protein